MNYPNRVEENNRKKIYLENLKMIQEHNDKDMPFTMKLYGYADRTRDEFHRMRTGLRMPA